MGGGALQEARRACGTRRRHAAGLVLTAIALAAAGTADPDDGDDRCMWDMTTDARRRGRHCARTLRDDRDDGEIPLWQLGD